MATTVNDCLCRLPWQMLRPAITHLASTGEAITAMSPKVLKPLRKGKALMETPRPEYYFENGLRKVKPYCQTYLAHIEAMKRGDVLVNDTVVSPDFVLKGGESLRSINCHRHEPPVPDTPIRVLEQTQDYIVFDKPHGITVHPNELNFFNTALEILRRDHDIPHYMHAVNRLDAVTSGVVIFANVADPAVRQRFQPPNVDTDAESDPLIQKEYICRVVGEFPKDPVVVKEPILQSTGKVAIDPAGKPSETRFVRRWYDPTSDSSLVSCYLATGRQHQIRLHVAHLQHPIVNDKLYNPGYKKDLASVNPELTINGETRFYPTVIPPESQPYMPYYITPEIPCHKCKEEREGANVPNPKNMKIWLRAIRYQGPDWKFEVDLPDWADPGVVK